MKIYISLDMEGVPGTWNWEQEKTDRSSVKKAIFNHTKDVLEAIIESEQNKNIKEIVIADSHSAGDNLSYDITEIDKRINLISGSPRPNYMMPLLDDSFAMVFFLGYHAGYGVQEANMDHTYSNSRIHRILINDAPMTEAFINAAYASTFGVPVTLISGDTALQEAVKDKMPWVEYITTKKAIAKFSAMNYSILAVRERTKEAVKKVLSHPSLYKSKLYQVSAPTKLQIEFKSTAMADVASFMPDTNRIDGRTIEYTHNDYRVIFNGIMALVTLSYSAGSS